MSLARAILFFGLALIGALGLTSHLMAQEDDDISALFEDADSQSLQPGGYSGQAPTPPLPPSVPAIPLPPPASPGSSPAPIPLNPPNASNQTTRAAATPASPNSTATIPPPPLPPTQTEGETPDISPPLPDIPRVQGQVITPPPPAWQKQSTESAGPIASGGPLPDFDSSQSRWRQIDVGQYDRSRNSSGGNNQGGPSPVVPQAVEDNPPPRPNRDVSSEQSKLRELFNDMLPPAQTPEPPSEGGTVTRPLTPPSATTAETKIERPAPPAERNLARPLTPPSEPPKQAPSQPPTRQVARPNPPTKAPVTPDPTLEGAALARAGSLLSERGLAPLEPKTGAATILSPESPPPSKAATKKTPTKVPPAKSAAAKSRPKASASNEKSPRANGSKSSPAKSAPALARPNLSVLIVNETGRAGVGENYWSVLTQIGYQVIGVSNGPSQPSGQTIITYQANAKGQAQALSRRLPGSKVMIQAPGSLPAGAVVTIR